MQNGATEHIWLQVDSHRDGVFRGRFANKPLNGSAYKASNAMTVPVSEIGDWSVTNRDVICGGYTARVALADMPEGRAKALAKRFRD